MVWEDLRQPLIAEAGWLSCTVMKNRRRADGVGTRFMWPSYVFPAHQQKSENWGRVVFGAFTHPPPNCFKKPEIKGTLNNTLVLHTFPEQSLLKLERTHLVKISLAAG